MFTQQNIWHHNRPAFMFMKKPDGSRTSQRDGVGWRVRAACSPEKVGYSWSCTWQVSGVAVQCGGMLHRKERLRASPCYLRGRRDT